MSSPRLAQIERKQTPPEPSAGKVSGAAVTGEADAIATAKDDQAFTENTYREELLRIVETHPRDQGGRRSARRSFRRRQFQLNGCWIDMVAWSRLTCTAIE